jgi:peroxiredoxin family protein
MDEMLLLLDMSMKNTIETKGRRCIPYLNTGMERKRISVIPCASEYGLKLQLMLIVKENKRLEQETRVIGIRAFKTERFCI